MRDAELKLWQKELELKEHELALQEQKAKQHGMQLSNKLLCGWAKCRHLQQQMQQITQLISFLAKSSYMRVYMCVYIML